MKKMNFYLPVFMWLCASQLLPAQNVPQGMRYQALAHDLKGNPMRAQTISLQVEILAGGPDGRVVYAETHRLATDPGGAFSLVIGEGNVQEGRFGAIPWSTAEIWLRTAIDEGGGNNFQLLGSSRLLAVPYAFHAGTAEMLQPAANSEKPGCNAPGIPFWSLQGNTLVNDTCHFIGTAVAVDLVFKTNQVERMRITKEGNLLVHGEAEITDNLYIKPDTVIVINQFSVLENASIEQALVIGGKLDVADNLTATDDTLLIRHQLVINEDAYIGQDALVEGNLKVNGNFDLSNSTLQVKCLNILGGCDWFEWSQSDDILKPGEVVVIDPLGGFNAVHRSTKAYDRTVVGVVSGAGDIRPGISLSQPGILDGNTPIALGGKVMVRITGNVRPGDLLCSSNIPGRAMAVKHRRKSHGAVLGKALSLPNEEGLVLMLVMMK
ncbi:MAG: hypothetical protein U0U46_13090 [Saprospiraceae bacterium]